MAGRVEVDLVRREARLDGEVVPLASKEFQLLAVPGRAARPGLVPPAVTGRCLGPGLVRR